jgi:hypothetical protein
MSCQRFDTANASANKVVIQEKNKQVILTGITTRRVIDAEATLRLLREGGRRRVMAKTSMCSANAAVADVVGS